MRGNSGGTVCLAARKKGSSAVLRNPILELLLVAVAVGAATAPPAAAQATSPTRGSVARDTGAARARPGGAPDTVGAAIGQDSVRKLVRRARRAESEYELLSRIRAPIAFAPSPADRCDEIVGRFCLRFDENERSEPPRPEAPAVSKARVAAIDALALAAQAAPADPRTARGLVRLLVEAHRDSAALVAARRFDGVAPGLWGELLLAFALHAAGDDTAAVAHFEAVRPQLSEKERRRLRIDYLVSPDEESAFKHLDPSRRAGYEAALWKLADPLYLTPGNEALGEHLARYVWTRMLSELPLVQGMTSWGDDLDELTFRYGVPTSRERIEPSIPLLADRLGMIEHYDPAQLAFLPESLLTVGVRPTPPPGEKWPLDSYNARSGYTAETVRHMLPLAVQVTRFPAGDSVVLRVDGAVALDSAARAADSTVASGYAADERASAGAVSGLFLLRGPDALLRGDTALLRSTAAPAALARDTASLSLSLTLPPGRYVYSAELLDRGSRLAARARHLVELPAPPPPGTPAISDVLVAQPFERRLPQRRDDPVIRARPEAAALPGDTLGLYAEVTGLTGGPDGHYRVELALSRTGEPPPPVRLWSWLRQRLGAAPPSSGISLSWTGQLPPRPGAGLIPGAVTAGAGPAGTAAPVALATDLVVPRLPPGLYTLRLRVVDGATGAAAATDRALLVRRPGRPGAR